MMFVMNVAVVLVISTLLGVGGPEAARSPEHANRLVNETSPYLLQHAYNPVNWYAWGPEAFEAARKANKPIFLSVGYSTCYWCHVMERESFEDEQVAAVMNEHVIAIKVDREERPDVDDVYMAAVQAKTGRGGWPMSVFLEPGSLKPFMGGTYYRKPSFIQLINTISSDWEADRAGVMRQADELAERVRRSLSASFAPVPLGTTSVEQAAVRIFAGYDPTHGGFQRVQRKFPLPARLELLIATAWDDLDVRAAVRHTLDRMAMGGIYDQIGGGFHRYSVDPRWLVPHFEKMLYDNAQLASVYAKVYERTGDEYYGAIVEETLDYVLREMTSPQGSFYSAQDAEVNAREGESYVWTPLEVRVALEAAEIGQYTGFALEVYGLVRGGNFRDPHHPNDIGRNVLHLSKRPHELAEALGLGPDAFTRRLALVKAAMLAARDSRDQPITDDKVIVEWNGLMICAMVDGARALGEPRYLEAAERAAQFILDNMSADDGGLLRTYRAGEARIDAFSRDYAHFIRGLLALHGATGDGVWLAEAVRLAGLVSTRFGDRKSGGYFDTLPDQADLFVRVKSMRDGVIACGNSVMVLDLLTLHERTGEAVYLKQASDTLASMSRRLRGGSASMATGALGLYRFLLMYPDRVPGGPDPVTPEPVNPVTVTVSTDSVEISHEAPGTFTVTLEIAEGFHVNAHEPGVEGVIGVNVRLVGRGVALEPLYPLGEELTIAEFGEPLLVHSGTVTIPLTIRRTGEIQGRPRMVLTYQACTDKFCLKPVRTLLRTTVVAR